MKMFSLPHLVFFQLLFMEKCRGYAGCDIVDLEKIKEVEWRVDVKKLRDKSVEYAWTMGECMEKNKRVNHFYSASTTVHLM